MVREGVLLWKKALAAAVTCNAPAANHDTMNMNLYRTCLTTKFVALCLLAGLASAAPRTAPFPGLREGSLTTHAIVGGKIIVSPERTIDNGTIIIRDGVIVAVGEKLAPPADAQIHSAVGKTIYPGFIDAYGEISADASRAGASDKAGASYWNTNIAAQTRAATIYAVDASANRKMRSQGITARLVAPSAGIVKGTSALVTTADEGGKQSIVKDSIAMHAKLTTARGQGGYPNSPMGAYTLVRQAFYDAGWYGQAWDAYQANQDLPRPERSDALAALRGYLGGKLLVIIDAPDELYLLRADRISKEFGLDTIIHGSGEEYRRLADCCGDASAGDCATRISQGPECLDAGSGDERVAREVDALGHCAREPRPVGRRGGENSLYVARPKGPWHVFGGDTKGCRTWAAP